MMSLDDVILWKHYYISYSLLTKMPSNENVKPDKLGFLFYMNQLI